jgi:hemerythrin
MTLQWEDRYSVGHDQVDLQHRHLFELVNKLEARIKAGDDRKATIDTIQSLIDYVLVHFTDEESLMHEIGFENIHTHRWRHSEFAGKIADMALAWGEGREVTAEQIREFLTDWLLDHILTEDMQIGAAVRRREKAASSTS